MTVGGLTAFGFCKVMSLVESSLRGALVIGYWVMGVVVVVGVVGMCVTFPFWEE